MKPAARKIVFVNRYFYPDQSATSQMLTDLACALADGGAHVHVICSRQLYENAAARLPAAENVRGTTVHRIWTTRFGRQRLAGRAFDYLTFYVAATVRMLLILNRGDILVAKTDPPLISVPAMAAAKIRGAELINWLQDIFPEVATALGANPLPRWLDSWLLRLRNRSLRGARRNVVLGRAMQAKLLHAGVPTETIRVISNWAEAVPAAPKATEYSELRARLELSGAFVVGYSGNLGRAHDFNTLLGAAELLRAEANVVFLMIGGGAGMVQLQRAVSVAGLSNFRFLPYQPREALADCLAAADVHWVTLIPSLEGLIVPSKYYGILAAGRPVIFIGDPEGELGRDIRDGACGYAVEIGASEKLAEILKACKDDSAIRLLMGHNSHRRHLDRYLAKLAFSRWEALVAEC